MAPTRRSARHKRSAVVHTSSEFHSQDELMPTRSSARHKPSAVVHTSSESHSEDECMPTRSTARCKRLAVVHTTSEAESTPTEVSEPSETEMTPLLDRIVDSIAMSIDTSPVQLPPPQLASPSPSGLTSKKYARGPARILAKLAPGQKFRLDWDEQNNPIGIHAAEFASYCGHVVRCEDNIPLTVKKWGEVPDENIKKSLDAVLEIFDYEQTEERLDYLYEDFAQKFRTYRNRLRKDHYYPYESDSERLENRPKNVSMDAWKWLVNYWGSNEFNEMSKINRRNREKHQMAHRAGRKSFARVIDEETKATGKRPKRIRVYTITHQGKNGVAVNKDAEEMINKVVELTTQPQDDPDAQPLSEDEAFDVLFPPDRRGRPKCTTRRFNSRNSGTHNTQSPQAVNPLQTVLEDTRTTLQAAQTQLHETQSALQATQVKLEQQEEKQLQQAKEMDDLRDQVGQLYTMMLTMRSNQGISYPPAPYFGGSTSLETRL